MNLYIRTVFAVCTLLALALGTPGVYARELVTNFVYVGCNRVGFGVEDPAPSTANVAQLKQTLADIAALPVKPKYFFFVGDLVLGMQADEGETLTKELDAWMTLLDESRFAGSGIELLPIPGNHEADASEKISSGDYIEYPDPDNLAVWVDWLKTNHFAKAGNGPSGEKELKRDLLAEDNNQIQTYSFDDLTAGVHYILLNTDSLSTVSNPLLPDKTVASWVPYYWVERDLAGASKNPEIQKIVVLAHKPLVLENPGPHDIVYNAAPYTLGDALLKLFSNTPKFAGYFCAHAHKWLYTDKLGPGRNVTQIIAGNGGSELEGDWSPAGGTYFGFTLVNLYDDNTVGVVSYNRPAPTPYNASAPQPVAKPTAEKFFSVIGKAGSKNVGRDRN
ncbi:MAG: metallophosphoesterase [Candidatus Thiodiazotropha sp.]